MPCLCEHLALHGGRPIPASEPATNSPHYLPHPFTDDSGERTNHGGRSIGSVRATQGKVQTGGKTRPGWDQVSASSAWHPKHGAGCRWASQAAEGQARRGRGRWSVLGRNKVTLGRSQRFETCRVEHGRLCLAIPISHVLLLVGPRRGESCHKQKAAKARGSQQGAGKRVASTQQADGVAGYSRPGAECLRGWSRATARLFTGSRSWGSAGPTAGGRGAQLETHSIGNKLAPKETEGASGCHHSRLRQSSKGSSAWGRGPGRACEHDLIPLFAAWRDRPSRCLAGFLAAVVCVLS